jgi:hypothetical protein
MYIFHNVPLSNCFCWFSKVLLAHLLGSKRDSFVEKWLSERFNLLKPFDSLLHGLDELPSILVKTRKDNLVQVDEKKKKKLVFPRSYRNLSHERYWKMWLAFTISIVLGICCCWEDNSYYQKSPLYYLKYLFRTNTYICI